MGRMYSVSFTGTAATVAVDFFEVTPAANKPLILHECFITQSSEIKDAEEEQCEVQIARGGTAMTSGSGGSAITPVALISSDPAASFTAEGMNTTKATFTGGVTVHRESFNVRTGWAYVPLPEDRILVHNGNGGLTFTLAAAPADSITWVGTLIVEEL